MIIKLLGTSGSGKSTLIRKVVEHYPDHEDRFVEGRKQPLYTYHYDKNNDDRRVLVVPGHYNSPCGGCDTINDMDEIFRIVRDAADDEFDVLMEGLIVSTETKRTRKLVEDNYPFLCVHMDLDLQLCVDSVNLRRKAKNPDKPNVNPRNTELKHKTLKRVMEKFREDCPSELFVTTNNREEALATVLKELKL